MITKEQLLKENGTLKDQNQTWSFRDATRRKTFAKVLGQVENKYGLSNMTPRDLSWEEIFCEIGKLISIQDFRSWKENMEFRLDSFKSQLQGKSPIEE